MVFLRYLLGAVLSLAALSLFAFATLRPGPRRLPSRAHARGVRVAADRRSWRRRGTPRPIIAHQQVKVLVEPSSSPASSPAPSLISTPEVQEAADWRSWRRRGAPRPIAHQQVKVLEEPSSPAPSLTSAPDSARLLPPFIQALRPDGLSISFQPARASAPPNKAWLVDTGNDLGVACSHPWRHPVLFGWIGEHRMQARDRRGQSKPGRSKPGQSNARHLGLPHRGVLRATLTHVDKDADRFMVALPPGEYIVTLGVGDPAFPGPLRFAVQGVQVWDGEPCDAGQFMTKKVRVTVPEPSAGKLTRQICGIDANLFLRLEGTAKPLDAPHRCTGFSTPGPDASRIAFLKIKPVKGVDAAFRRALAGLARTGAAAAARPQTAASEQGSATARPVSRAASPLRSARPRADFLLCTSPKPIAAVSPKLFQDQGALQNAQLSLQRVMASWALTAPRIETIIFTHQDAEMRALAESFGLRAVRGPKPHPVYHSPRYRDVFDSALQFRSGDAVPKLFGFANADVMFHPNDLSETLSAVAAFASSSSLVFVAGRRTDVVVPFHFKLEPTAAAAGAQLDTMRECGHLFVEGSADYFFVTPALWRTWRRTGSVPEFVLGGVGADNYLLNLAAATKGVVSVDGTQTISCVHQEHENMSHERENRKSAFNRGLMRLPWKTDGSTESLRFYTKRDQVSGKVVVVKRR
jgi:hypothetical protein